MSKRKKQAAAEAHCVYCGAFGKVTEDHVIPQCLFEKPLPPDTVKVPACNLCNNKKSKDDGYLRDILVTDVSTSNHPTAKAIFREKSLSAHRQNKSEFLRYAVATLRPEPMYTPGGIYLGHVHATKIEKERLSEIIMRMVRGLYYNLYRKRIPDDYKSEVTRWDVTEPRKFNEYAAKVMPYFGEPRRIGKVLEYGMRHVEEDPFATHWLLLFYGGMRFTVITNSYGFEADRPEAGAAEAGRELPSSTE